MTDLEMEFGNSFRVKAEMDQTDFNKFIVLQWSLDLDTGMDPNATWFIVAWKELMEGFGSATRYLGSWLRRIN